MTSESVYTIKRNHFVSRRPLDTFAVANVVILSPDFPCPCISSSPYPYPKQVSAIMGACMSTGVIEVSEEDKRRNKEVEKELKEVRTMHFKSSQGEGLYSFVK